jgi:DNA-binding GntR family transcriptional regulator
VTADPRLGQAADLTIKLLAHYNAMAAELADRSTEEELAELRTIVQQANEGILAALNGLGVSRPPLDAPDW